MYFKKFGLKGNEDQDEVSISEGLSDSRIDSVLLPDLLPVALSEEEVCFFGILIPMSVKKRNSGTNSTAAKGRAKGTRVETCAKLP